MIAGVQEEDGSRQEGLLESFGSVQGESGVEGTSRRHIIIHYILLRFNAQNGRYIRALCYVLCAHHSATRPACVR